MVCAQPRILENMNDLNDNNRQLRQEPPGMWESWSRGQILALAILLMAGNFLFQVVFYLIRQDLFGPVLAGALAGVLVPMYLMVRRWDLSFSGDFGLTFPHPVVLAAAAMMSLCSVVPTSLLAEFSIRLHPIDPQWLALYEEHLPTTTMEIILAGITVVIVAPLAEEIIFRGLLQRVTASLWGTLPAVLISALVFGIVHGEPWFLFGLIGVGLVLAFIFAATGSVTACWVAHAVHNAISLWVMLGSVEATDQPQEITTADWGLAAVSVIGMLVVGKFLLAKGKAQYRKAGPGSIT